MNPSLPSTTDQDEFEFIGIDPPRRTWRARAAAGAASLALILAACGSDADTTSTAAADAPASLAAADDAMEDDAMEDEAMADDAMEDEAMADDAMEEAVEEEAMDDDYGDAMDDEAMADEAMEDAMSDESHSAVAVASTDLGDVLVDGTGLTLYGFTQDVDGQSVCNGDCAVAWPPLTVDGADVPAGLDAEVFSVIVRDDGSYQLAAGGWPLYTFIDDAAPGDTNGQGVNDVWYVVTADGELVTEVAESGGSSDY